MPVRYTIRDARREDTATILHLIRELARFEKLEDEVVATESTLRNSLFEEKAAYCRLAEDEHGAVAGFALFFHNFSTFLGHKGLYIEDLYVREQHRGQGLGEAMLRDLARIALDRNCGRMEWWVLDWNKPAIGFYKKMAAEPMSDWTVFRLTKDKLQQIAAAEN